LNEHTGGCSPAVLAAIRSLTREELACYPDYDEVTRACERWFEVPRGWVQLTNGLDEGLKLVVELAARPPSLGQRPPSFGEPSRETPAIIVEPAFEMYAASADAIGLAHQHIPPDPNFRFQLDAILAAISPATRLIFLTDPNNPTGLPIPAGAVERIASAAPDALVLLDEAYAEYSGHTLIGDALERHRNLIVGRTFAKAFGMAGLRAGALVAHPDTLAPIRRHIAPFNVNVVAARALRAALEDRAYVAASVSAAAESRELVYAWCRQRGVMHWPSQGNFVLMRIGDPTGPVVQRLAERGILVRDRTMAPGCAGCIRITAGVVEHTRACLSALEEALASRAN
jgi:histidinol-phosphate aminotransferase